MFLVPISLKEMVISDSIAVSSPSSLITCIIQNLLMPSSQRIRAASTEVQMLSNKQTLVLLMGEEECLYDDQPYSKYLLRQTLAFVNG